MLIACESDTKNRLELQGKGLTVETNIAKDLKNTIELTGVKTTKLDKKQFNVIYHLNNLSGVTKSFEVSGIWLDSAGRQLGSSKRIYNLRSNEKQEISDSTNSLSASVYRLKINEKPSTEKDSLMDTLTLNNVAEGYGMTYSETASDEKIPSIPLFGMANGEVFKPKTVVFAMRNKGEWWLEISDATFDPKSSPGIERYQNPKIQSIHIKLQTEPSENKTLTKNMSYGGGYFQIKKSPNADETITWNTSLAYLIEITQWQKKEIMGLTCSEPSLGRASGKLFISFKGSSIKKGMKNSFVSGMFTEVPIVYCGSD